MTSSRLQAPAARVEVDYDPFAGGELLQVVPTTEPQREVWLAAKLDQDASLAYNESVSLRLRGAIDVERLKRALQKVVDRHDALRASIAPDGEGFCVPAPQPFEVVHEDLSGLAGKAREEAVRNHRERGVGEVFALERGRLFRAELLRLQTDDHLLLMHAHHIVCDGWSWWVMVREIGTLYRDPAAQLPAAESFADYALRCASHPQGETFLEDERYWMSRFPDELPVLELPLDRPRPMRRTTASAREDRVLDAPLTSALKQLGARRGVSLFATLLNGFAVLLSRISGQDRVVVGIPAAGQSVDGHEHLVGHCVNLLPLRFDLDHGASFSHSLGMAQETLLDALDHQRYTFGTLLKQLRVPRDPSRTPLVSVLFNIDQALDPEKTGFEGLGLDFTTNPRTHDNFELSINAVQVDGQLRLECQYNRDLFDAATVRRWLTAYETLLRGAVDKPDEAMARLPLVDAPALAELAAQQPTPAAFDRDCLMHEHFERQCDRAPDRIAARFGDASLSYRQLEARANRIAHLLRRHGVGRGDLVGLSMERGLDMLASLLGILKAGAGYVPLDPAFPQGRLAYMAEDAALAVLVTQQHNGSRYDLPGKRVLALDALEPALAAEPDTRVGRDARAGDAESIAYVIYTSGSTGKPKGVALPHRAVSNLIASMQRSPGMVADDRLLAVTTLSFDISVVEMILPLSVGAQVVLASKDVIIDGFALAELLQSSKATVMQATPATWRMLLETDWKGHPALKIFCGGEPMQPDLAMALLARCGQLWNLYGPTETTVYSTGMRVMPPQAGQRWPDIHIGRPLDNTQVWIMDAQGQLCPYGASGEICIGGEGVALGYLNRAELTAERFLPDALAGTMSGFGTGIAAPTLYRTGDRGRWRPDGNIEHQGRLDFQVKVRGYRIELGEIENTLAAHPAITRAVAMAREDRPGDVRLVAYVVPLPGTDIQDAALAAHLRQTLPDYMVPQHFVHLPAIPLLPNGKVDRKALPAPGAARSVAAPDAKVATEGPRDPLEARVLQAMEQILGRAGLDMEANFFEAGGHSLLAAQLCARLGRELDIIVSLRQLFDTPTARQLSEALRVGLADPHARAPQALAVPHRAEQSSAPMTLMQQRLWVIDQMEPGSIVYNAPSAHRLHGRMDLQALSRAFEEIVRRQGALRTILVPQGELAVQKVLDHVDASLLPPTDLSHLPEPQRMAALMEELEALTARPFVLDQAPLFRAKLYRLAEDDHLLYFMPHHVIWDGWSFDVFYTEMSALYEAFAAGRPSPLPPLEVTYADFAAWHVQQVEGEAMARQMRYWTGHLAGKLEPLRLPQDKPRPERASGIGGTDWVHLDATTTERLRQVGVRAGATLFMTLLAAYYVLLHRLSGQDDLVVGMPFRNRPTEALEKVMGFFVNMLPLRRKLDPGMPFLQLVRDVKAGLVEAFEYPDVPLERLVRELKVPRDPGRSPIYQALFSFQDVRARNLHWGELQHEHLLLFQKGISQDLGIWFLEHPAGLSGAMGYNADIITETGARAIGDRFVALLESLAGRPEQAIGDVVGPKQPVDAGSGAGKRGDCVEPERSDGRAAAFPEPAMQDAPAARRAAPKRTLDGLIAEHMAQVLGVAAVGADEDFFDLGGHSLLAVQLFHRLRQSTQVNLPLTRMLAAPTPRLLAQAFREEGAADDEDTTDSIDAAGAPLAAKDHWAPLLLLRKGTSNNGRPLFLIHAVGGNVLNYRALAQKLDRSLTVYGIQALGLDGRTRPLGSVEAMGERYVAEIRSVQPHGPYRIAGGSMGGLISYEVAQQLCAAGQEVEFLGLFDTSSGRSETHDGPRPPSRLSRYLAELSLARLKASLGSRIKRLQLRAKVAVTRAVGAELPHEIRYDEVHRVHYGAAVRYEIRPYPGDIVLYRATEQPSLFRGGATLGWSSLVRNVAVVEIPGSHEDLVEADELAQELNRTLTSLTA